MKMKKVMTAALTLGLTISMGNTVFASEQDPTPLNNTADIKVSYNEGNSTTENVYSVDVEWGSLEYTYDSGESQIWNPETLKYEIRKGAPKWTCSEGADKITVKNHSNVAVMVFFDYGKTNADVTGSFSKKNVTLDAPVEGNTNAPSETVTLTLTGTLSGNPDEKMPVGTATVSIKGVVPVAVGTDPFNPGSQIDIYPTERPGVYTAIYTPPKSEFRIGFTIDGINYNMKYSNLTTNGTFSTISCTAGTTYQFTFDINNLTFQKKPLTS